MVRSQDQKTIKRAAREVNSVVKLVSSLMIGGFGLLMIYQASPRFQKNQRQAPIAESKLLVSEPKAGNSVNLAKDVQKLEVKASAVVAMDLQKTVQENFVANLEELKSQLPSQEALQKKTAAEVHDTPPEIVEAGFRLGKIKEQWLQAPHLRPLALQFYSDCFSGPSTVTSVRALCLSNARALASQLRLNLDEAKASFEVKKLADQL
jgi:hypothetical protein